MWPQEDAREALPQATSIAALLSAPARLPSDYAAQSAAVTAAATSAPARFKLVNAGAVEVVLNGLRRHKADRESVLAGWSALRALGDDAKGVASQARPESPGVAPSRWRPFTGSCGLVRDPSGSQL